MSRSARWSAGGKAAIASGGSLITARTASRSSTPAVVSVKRLHPAVAFGAAALDEAPRLEPVDEARHVRGVAEQPLRQRAHRHRLVGVEHAQRVGLGEAEAELGERRAGLRALGHADLEEEPLRLVSGGGPVGQFRRHTHMILETVGS